MKIIGITDHFTLNILPVYTFFIAGNMYSSPGLSLPQSPTGQIMHSSDRIIVDNLEKRHYQGADKCLHKKCQCVPKEDYTILLNKVASIQEEKWAMEQRLSMLEASSSAMADDLVQKSDIILHYCMEAGKHRNGKNKFKL